MGNFGDTLRQEREFRGITLDAITRVTKISNRHLVALEQEHFDVLPGGVFNKSMVREYARVVGLDQEEWVGRYLSAHQSTGTVIDEDGWMRFAENASKARGESALEEPPRPAAALDGHRDAAAAGGRSQLVRMELCPQENLSRYASACDPYRCSGHCQRTRVTGNTHSTAGREKSILPA